MALPPPLFLLNIFFLKISCILLRKRERESSTRGSIPRPWDHDLNRRQPLNHLNHPGTFPPPFLGNQARARTLSSQSPCPPQTPSPPAQRYLHLLTFPPSFAVCQAPCTWGKDTNQAHSWLAESLLFLFLPHPLVQGQILDLAFKSIPSQILRPCPFISNLLFSTASSFSIKTDSRISILLNSKTFS